jgi:hypothetical protein
MRGRAVLVLVSITALGAYSLGRQNAPANDPPRPVPSPHSAVAAPLSLVGTAASPQAVNPSSRLLPTKASLPGEASPADAGKPPGSPADTKRKVETALTAAAIAAIIINASRDQYHASGRPCACPDDTARNGSSCGGRSAYSRPGGAAPLCYPSDVTDGMIEAFRQRQATR